MSRGLKFVLFAFGFLLATGLEAARAAEGYLCEGGRIVYAPVGKLEDLKRTDPCIAAYHGLKVAIAPKSAAPVAATAVAAKPAAATSFSRAPAEAARVPVSPAGPAALLPPSKAPSQSATGHARPSTTTETGSLPESAKLAASGSRGDSERAAVPRTAPQRLAGRRLPPRATDGTDYRNVPLLNAPPGAPTIYRHEL